MSKIEAFLKKLGVKSDVINKLNSEDETNLDELVQSYKSGYREVMLNDPEFIQPIKDEIKGSELSKIEHKIKKTFGLSSEEIKDKKFDEIIGVAFEKVKNSGNQTSDELQQKLIELTRENKRLTEEIIPAKENEAKEYIKSYKKESTLKGVLSSKPLTVKPEIAYLTINDYLSKNYNVDIDDNNQFVLKTKNGLNPLNEDGTKVLQFDEIIDKKLMDDGLLKQSNGDPNKTPMPGKKSVIEKQSDENKYVLPGIKIAQENAERMKNIRTFGQ